MKNWIKQIFYLTLIAFLGSCAEEVGDYTVRGEAITNFELEAPINNDTVTINTQALTEHYMFTWGEAESGLGSPLSYTIIFDLAEGDFSAPIWSKLADDDGATAKATLTFDELQQIYTAAGASDVASVKWNVKVENGSPNVITGQTANFLKIALSSDGVSDFNLVAPLDKSALQVDGEKENEVFAFDWDDASSTSGNLTYKFYLDVLNGDFSDPLVTAMSDNDGTASQLSMTHAEWKALLDANEIPNGSYKWTVKAISSDLEWMNQEFELFIEQVNWSAPIYIVGEATEVGWDIDNALEVFYVTPNFWTGVYNLKAGKEFKFFPERGSWDNGIGADRFETFIGCTGMPGGNIRVDGSADGPYMVIVDLGNKTLTVSPAPRVLGGSVAADWNPGASVPLQYIGDGVYDTYQYITVDGFGFKFVPLSSGWDGDLGASKTAEKLLAQTDEDNLSVPSDGFYRVRLNMNTFEYEVTETNWGIIGDATPGGWGDDTDLIFTNVKGDYKWSAEITLTDGELKFRANDDWDINLGDNSADGSLEYDGDNIKVTAGTYLIELILDSSSGFTYSITAK